MNFSPAQLQLLLSDLPPVRGYRVAFSGGCDSVVLLHALVALRDRIGAPISAIHVDHGLHPNSRDWSRQCEVFCAQLAIPCVTVRVDATSQKGESREAAARRARYAAFAENLREGEAIVTAHHQDDQAETFLLQLLRGAGTRGLSAMPESAPFAKGWLLRPLLHVARAQLCRYATAQGLQWIDDPSNFDVGFDRNFLRHEVMPRLHERWTGAQEVIGRAARLQGEASELLDVLAEQDCAVACEHPDQVCISALTQWSPARQRNLLRYALRRCQLPLPSSAQLERILTEVIPARGDGEPCVTWPGGEVRRYRDLLFLLKPLGPVPQGSLSWIDEDPLTLPAGLGRLHCARAQGEGMRIDGEVEIRFRQGGERCRPAGRAHHQTLKQLLQEAGVPPWERERLPLIYVNGELAAVADLWVCDSFAVNEGEEGIVIRWDRFAIENEGENGDNLPGLGTPRRPPSPP